MEIWSLLCQYNCMHRKESTNVCRKLSRGTTQVCCVLSWSNPGNSTLQKSCCPATYLLSLKPSKKGEQDMLGTARYEVRMNSSVMFFYELSRMDTPVYADQEKLISIISVDLPRAEADRDGWLREIQRNPCCQHALIMRMMMMVWSIIISLPTFVWFQVILSNINKQLYSLK